MRTQFEKNDINYEFAKSAYYWSSFAPEKRAEQEQRSYVETGGKMLEIVEKQAKTDEQKEVAEKYLSEYKERLLKKWKEYLSAKSRTASAGVTGPSKFPTERNRKALDVEQKRLEELLYFIKNSRENLIKLLDKSRPEEDTNNDIKRQILINVGEIVSVINDPMNGSVQLFRSNFRGRMLTIAKNHPEMIDYIIEKMKQSKTKIFIEKNSFWTDLEKIKQKSAEPKKETTSEEINGVRIVKNYDIDRVQLFFNGKPSQETISKLKHSAFHWSPSTKSWMRKLTPSAICAAEQICKEM